MGYVTQPGAIGVKATRDTPREGIFRVLDAQRDKAAVITRTLGRAAFEATKDGSTVVMLSAWPESVAGLTAWASEDGAIQPRAAFGAAEGARRQVRPRPARPPARAYLDQEETASASSWTKYAPFRRSSRSPPPELRISPKKKPSPKGRLFFLVQIRPSRGRA
ncbi:hypothetical protein ACTTAI_08035 [Rhodobacter capsulatus]|uniref:hypothetical protein n=1 Tax=Rhodobacter capsulatus TaxID=1061 RepID=UPI004026FE3A